MIHALEMRPETEQLPIGAPAFHHWLLADGSVWSSFFRVNGGYLVRFPGLADFQVSADCSRVIGAPVPGTDMTTMQHLFLNQVTPLVLSHQGVPVFHASAVALGNGAVAFLGETGRGKSTLAASFATHDQGLLTDDALILEIGPASAQIVPSHPSVRLWDDSQDALFNGSRAAAPATQFTSKSRFLTDKDLLYCEMPTQLSRAYFLGDGSSNELVIRPLSAAEAMIEWIKHSFLLDVENKVRLALQFGHVAKLADWPIHYRLDFPRRYEDLPAVRDAIQRHLLS